MLPPSATNNELRLISAVITAAMAEAGSSRISCSAVSRRLFEMVQAGEHDFEVLKAAALSIPLSKLIALSEPEVNRRTRSPVVKAARTR